MGHGKSKLFSLRHKMLQCNSSRALRHLLAHQIKDNDFNIDTLIRTEGEEEASLLWLATRYSDSEVLTHLIEMGADVNLACCPLQMTPLHVAAHNHNVKTAELLLAAGACPNVLDKWNYTPIMYAAIHHEPFLVEQFFQVFLRGGCDVNFGACLTSEGQLEQPNSNTELAELETGFSSTYITYVRQPAGPVSGTPLHLAIQNPYLPNEVIQLLVKAGADVNRQNLYGQTPLMGAVLDIYYDYHSNVQHHLQLLLSCGADVNVQDRRGWSAMHYAAQRGSVSCMEILMQAGCCCNVSGSLGERPLWLLLILGWQEAAKFLIRNGCDLDKPLRSIVILQVNQNADVCRYGPIYPLEFAVCNRYYSMAELIITAGAPVTSDMWLGQCITLPQPRHVQFEEFLAAYRASQMHVQPLRKHCRDAIRYALHQSIGIKIEQLCLPSVLKDYILLKDCC